MEKRVEAVFKTRSEIDTLLKALKYYHSSLLEHRGRGAAMGVRDNNNLVYEVETMVRNVELIVNDHTAAFAESE